MFKCPMDKEAGIEVTMKQSLLAPLLFSAACATLYPAWYGSMYACWRHTHAS